jgi:hypothetical protein
MNSAFPFLGYWIRSTASCLGIAEQTTWTKTLNILGFFGFPSQSIRTAPKSLLVVAIGNEYTECGMIFEG